MGLSDPAVKVTPMSEKAINILVSHSARLIYVGLPKCGSSSIVAAFLRMSGFDPKPRKVRSLAKKARSDGRLAAAQMEFKQCLPGEIQRTIAENPGYKVFASVRDPYSRIVSGYFNKLNRYTKAYMKPTYYHGKLRQFMAGPGKWDRVEIGNKVAHKKLSFTQFLQKVEQIGVAFDSHFELQTRLLDLDNVSYDKLIRMEDLAAAFPETLRDFGVAEDLIARIGNLPQANKRMDDKSDDAFLTSENKARIATLYKDDFERLGYPV